MKGAQMPKASKETASDSMTLEGYEGHFEELGGYTVGFETYTADADMAPLFAGLPDDRCQCAHLGYVLKGKVKFTYAGGSEEVYETGKGLPRALRAYADALRGYRDRRVQPHRATAADDGSRDPQHGGR